jgi:hypothetical protein
MANIYKNFSPDDIVTVKKKVTKGVFSGNASNLTSFFTGSQAAETGSTEEDFITLMYFNTGSTLSTAAVQFH